MKNAKKNKTVKNLSPYLVLGIIICVILLVLGMQGDTVKDLSTGKLLTALKNNEVTEITIMPKSDESVYYVRGKLKDYKQNGSFESLIVEAELDSVTDYIKLNNIEKYSTDKDPGSSMIMYI